MSAASPAAGHCRHRRARVGLALAIVASALPAIASEPAQQTLAAYQQYVAEARQAFLDRIERDEVRSGLGTSPIASSVPSVSIRGRGQLVKVPGGLVHHWSAAVLLPGVTLDQVLRVAQDYDDYASVHTPVISARLVSRTGNTFYLALRMKEGAGPISGVLDVRSAVTYSYVRDGAYSFSETTDLRQVKNAGQANESHDAGAGGTVLWRANTFTRFSVRRDGVYVDLETLALTRTIPPLLRWMLEPIARKLGRTSVERTLREFRKAVLQRAA